MKEHTGTNMKYSEALKKAVGTLAEHRRAETDSAWQEHDEAALDVWYLMEEISGYDRAAWFLHSEETMPAEKEAVFFEQCGRLLANEPVSYILGWREFMGLRFHVNRAVLIPRQDTELLAEEAIRIAGHAAEGLNRIGDSICTGTEREEEQEIKEANGGDRYKENRKTEQYRILDLCTGSGCIAVSVKKFLENYGDKIRVDASDISEAALQVAEKNAAENGTEVHFMKSNMFEEISGKYNMIVSNPPYIPKEQIDGLDKKVISYEPYNALYGGKDGLDFYRRIAADAGRYLKPGGSLLLEIGFDQGETVPELLKANGFTQIEVRKDYNHLDRVVTAQFYED